MDQDHIRNFSIIAHIDHGKSTLADRILQLTDTVADRDMREQLLDSMELERERGITIKAQAVRVALEGPPAQPDRHARARRLHLRGLAVAAGVRGRAARRRRRAGDRGADARERLPRDREQPRDRPGREQDRPAVGRSRRRRGRGRRPDRRRSRRRRCGSRRRPGSTSRQVLDAIVERIPPPDGDPDAPPRALIFDSSYDQYRGVVAFVRVVDGRFETRERRCARWRSARSSRPRSSGSCRPTRVPVTALEAGEVGYVITGLKDVSALRVGDTLTTAGARRRPSRCPGYKDVKPMVFAGLFPSDSDDYPELRDALERLKLNDARALLRARDVAGARLRLPLRLPRPAPHGDRARAARARVRPRPDRHRAERRLPGARAQRRLAVEVHNPSEMPAELRGGRGAVHPGLDHRPEGVRRHRDGAEQRAPRHASTTWSTSRQERVHLDLRAAARRDRARLLRPAQVAHARLRELRLRPLGLPGRASSCGSTCSSAASRSTRSR